MKPYRRTATVMTTLALAGAGLLGLTACGQAGPSVAGSAVGAADPGSTDVVAGDLAATLGADGAALAALGFAPAEFAEFAPAGQAPAGQAAPAASASPDGDRRGDRRRPLKRQLLRGRVLHGEAVVRTDDGTKTVVSQRGTITAIDDASVTVKSADGFTLTWTFSDQLRVVERRRTIQPTDLTTGAEIGLAGAKDGDRAVARLIVHRVD